MCINYMEKKGVEDENPKLLTGNVSLRASSSVINGSE